MQNTSRHILSVLWLAWACLSAGAFQVGTTPRLSLLRTEVEEESSSSSPPKTTTTKPKQQESVPLPPVIQSIADERLEYQMNVGKAMDVLRNDYKDILRKKPDFSIYDSQIELTDPSGVQLRGLDKYKSAFAFFQGFLSFWFSTQRSGLQFRMVYDFCRCSIRISWNCVLLPKIPGMRPLHVDGISHYQLDRTSGEIVEHKIENLMLNNSPAVPPYSLLVLLQQDMARMRQQTPQGVPAGAGALAGAGFQ